MNPFLIVFREFCIGFFFMKPKLVIEEEIPLCISGRAFFFPWNGNFIEVDEIPNNILWSPYKIINYWWRLHFQLKMLQLYMLTVRLHLWLFLQLISKLSFLLFNLDLNDDDEVFTRFIAPLNRSFINQWEYECIFVFRDDATDCGCIQFGWSGSDTITGYHFVILPTSFCNY